MTVILIIIGIGILAFNFWSTLSIRSFFKRTNKREQINDQKYWELKYNIQSLVTIFAVIVGIAGYLGVNTLDDIKKSITKELKPQLDTAYSKISQMKDGLQRIDTTLKNYGNDMKSLRENSNAVSNSLTISKSGLNALKQNVNDINKKNKIQAPVYVVNNLEVDNNLPAMDIKATKYFENLVTSTGDRLPVFNKPPTIIVASNGGGTYAVTHITKTSFRISPLEYIGLESAPESLQFSKVTILIIQNP
ncbi:MAG: hypothetical protein JWQ09_653 [Segetibacter sp.]|nr:hypothetical protein [Segetibacter sp.]